MLKKLVLNSRKYIKVVNQNAVRKGPFNIDSWTYLNPKEKEKKKELLEREKGKELLKEHVVQMKEEISLLQRQ